MPSNAWLKRKEERRRIMEEHGLTLPERFIPGFKSDWIFYAPDNVCPRCQGDIPAPGKKGAHDGAVSRTDNRTEICSPCGDREAKEDLVDALIPQSEWPVKVLQDLPSHDGSLIDLSWEKFRGSKGLPVGPPPVPREIPDLRLHLLDRWAPGGTFEQAAKSAFGVIGSAAAHSEMQRRTLKAASLWWVKSDMLALVGKASESMPTDVRASELDLPDGQQSGFVVFEKPWFGQDAQNPDNLIEINAFTWTVDRGVLSFSMYTYFDFLGGMSAQKLDLAVKTGAIYEAHPEAHPETGGTGSVRLRGATWMFVGRSDWPLEEALNDFSVSKSDLLGRLAIKNEVTEQSMMEDRRFFTAFCVLINHKLSNTETVTVSRPQRRRAERVGITNGRASTVRYIRLREARKEYEGDEDPDREKKQVAWSHRWFSRGHMGWRWVGPRNAENRKRRLVWVAPSIKGPEDLPLVLKETVRTWVR